MKELMFQKQNTEKNNRALGYCSNFAQHSQYDFPGNNISECSFGSSSSSSSNVPNDSNASRNRRERITLECVSRIPATEGRVCRVVSLYSEYDSVLVGCSTNSIDVGRGVLKSYCVILVRNSTIRCIAFHLIFFITISYVSVK